MCDTPFHSPGSDPKSNLFVSPRLALSSEESKSIFRLMTALLPSGPLWVRLYPGSAFDGHSGWRRHVFVVTVTVPHAWPFPAVLFRNRPHGGLRFANRLSLIAFLICHEASHAYFSGTDRETEFNCDLQALYFLRDLQLQNVVAIPRPLNAPKPVD